MFRKKEIETKTTEKGKKKRDRDLLKLKRRFYRMAFDVAHIQITTQCFKTDFDDCFCNSFDCYI